MIIFPIIAGIIAVLVLVTALISGINNHIASKNSYNLDKVNEDSKIGLASVNHNNYSKKVPDCFEGAEKTLKEYGIEDFSIDSVIDKD